MIPLRDNIPSRTTAVVNYSLIGVCILVFFAQLGEENTLIEEYGMIPARVVHPDQQIVIREPVLGRTPDGIGIVDYKEHMAAPAAVPAWLTLLTCVFLHGGWMHIIGNLWFLHIFGDNVEDRMGHVPYLLFYLGCGVAASLAHLMTDANSMVPTIGASGAIAGVMGAYFVLYPKGMVLTLIPIFVFLHMVVIPAPVFLGIWFLFQFLQGAMSSSEAAGVAWWAHIGGFVVGVGIALLLRATHHVSPPVQRRVPYADHMTHYRVGREPEW